MIGQLETNSKFPASVTVAFVLLFISGCSWYDADEARMNCIFERHGISSYRVEGCKADPIFTDCGLRPSDGLSASECGKKYVGVDEVRAIYICAYEESRFDDAPKVFPQIARVCREEHSGGQGEDLRNALVVITNLLLLGFVGVGIMTLLTILVPDSYLFGDSKKKKPKSNSGAQRPVRKMSPDEAVRRNTWFLNLDENNGLMEIDESRVHIKIDGQPFLTVLANVVDIIEKTHLCKRDYQRWFVKLGSMYLDGKDSETANISPEAVIRVLQWAEEGISMLSFRKDVAEKRKLELLDLIDRITNR